MTWAADKMAEPGISFVADCGSVHAAGTASRRAATSEKRPWAGLWQDGSGLMGGFVKVKAHLTRGEAAARGQGHLWVGNDHVDRLAKGLAQTLLPPREVRDETDALVDVRRAFLSWWPRGPVRLPPLCLASSCCPGATAWFF